ncbi:MAG: hypothetical protein IKM94_03335 [Alphaproteobacteria bacterium]|nr:hypothetical protein [Alphaproteobacteria bacterium]
MQRTKNSIDIGKEIFIKFSQQKTAEAVLWKYLQNKNTFGFGYSNLSSIIFATQ